MITQIVLSWILLASHAQAAKPVKSKTQIVEEQVRAIESTLTKCDCRVSANTREAGEAPLGKTTIKDFKKRTFPITVLNDEYAIKIFQQMTSKGDIPFGFPEDGCFGRAHEMSYILDQKGILTGKIMAHGRFRIDSEKAENDSVTWSFHVAPIIAVDTGSKLEVWVIDPSLFFEPVSLTKWLSTLTAHPKSSLRTAYVTTKFIYHPKSKERDLTAFDPEELAASKRMLKRYKENEKRRTKRKSPYL